MKHEFVRHWQHSKAKYVWNTFCQLFDRLYPGSLKKQNGVHVKDIVAFEFKLEHQQTLINIRKT